MKRRLLLLSVIIISLAISGCIDSTTKITVNGDGSGIITETMGMSKEVVKQMQQMMPSEDGQAITDENFFKREDFVEKALEYGQDVKLIDFKTSSNETSIYAQAVFEFKDVAKIRIKQGDNSGVDNAQDPAKDEKYITFNFDKSTKNPTLKINIPQEDTAETETVAAQPPVEKLSAAEAAMIKQMFTGMHFAGLIEVNGKITSTNAQYVEGSTVSLFDVQFDKILDKPELLAQLQTGPGSQSARDILEGIDGIKLDTNKEINVTFTPAGGDAIAGSLDEAIANSGITNPMDFSASSLIALCLGMGLVLLIPFVIVSILSVWFYARILKKAGFSPALAFLLLIPVLNTFIGLVILMILAFVDWPVYGKFAAITDQINDPDDELVADVEPVVITEEPEIKIDDTSSFNEYVDSSEEKNGGVPLPGESNHTRGPLDSEKLSQDESKSEAPISETPANPEIILSSGNLPGEESKEEPIKEDLSLQTPSIEPVEPVKIEENEPPKIIEIPDVEPEIPQEPIVQDNDLSQGELSESDVLKPEITSIPDNNEDNLKMPDVESHDELNLPDAPKDTPKLPTEDEEEADKDKPVV